MSREILMCFIHTTGLRAFGQIMYMRVGGTTVETMGEGAGYLTQTRSKHI
jgi:hypothetical protein